MEGEVITYECTHKLCTVLLSVAYTVIRFISGKYTHANAQYRFEASSARRRLMRSAALFVGTTICIIHERCVCENSEWVDSMPVNIYVLVFFRGQTTASVFYVFLLNVCVLSIKIFSQPALSRKTRRKKCLGVDFFCEYKFHFVHNKTT